MTPTVGGALSRLSQNDKLTLYPDRYTYEEDKLIVEELLKITDTYIPIRGLVVWEPIAEEFHRKRGSRGFYADRSTRGLRDHFVNSILHNPNGRVKVPVTLVRKFVDTLQNKIQGDGGSSSRPASQSQQTDSPVPNETQAEDEWESMIKELQEAPYELDFSKLGESASSAFSIPDDLNFADFEDFEE